MAQQPEWLALELSSFQLHDTPGINPTVGVLTNLSPDHLDRYESVGEYYADKARLFANAHDGSKWILNADDETVMQMADGVPGHRATFSTQSRPADASLDRGHNTLTYHHDQFLAREELALLGDHNVANALAAWLAVMEGTELLGDHAAWDRLAVGLRTFRPLSHRMEIVGEFGGVQWINDSKATNVSSTLVALRGMTRPYILLLGGRHKGEPYTALAEAFASHGKKVIAFGEAAGEIEHDLRGRVPLERLGSSFDDVMRRARELAAPGDAVLLSPACSSYDMFTNYEHRGAEFRRLAAESQL
jgi:UDP-N-acetylmuramoylalanine--D-glutamate ligase